MLLLFSGQSGVHIYVFLKGSAFFFKSNGSIIVGNFHNAITSSSLDVLYKVEYSSTTVNSQFRLLCLPTCSDFKIMAGNVPTKTHKTTPFSYLLSSVSTEMPYFKRILPFKFPIPPPTLPFLLFPPDLKRDLPTWYSSGITPSIAVIVC